MARFQMLVVFVVCYLAHYSLSAPITKRGACLTRFSLRDETCSVTCDYSTGKCEEKVSATECDCEGNKKETKSSASFEEGELLKEEGDKKTIGSCEKLISRCSTCKKINGTIGKGISSASASKSELCGKAVESGNPTKEPTKGTNGKEGKGGLDFFKFPKVPVFKFPEVPVIEEVDIFGIPIVEIVEEIGVGMKKKPVAAGKQEVEELQEGKTMKETGKAPQHKHKEVTVKENMAAKNEVHHHHHHVKHEKKADGHHGEQAQPEAKGNENKVEKNKAVQKKQEQDEFEVIMA